MLREIEESVRIARDSWAKSKNKVPVNIKQLVTQMSSDIKWAIDNGDWGLAVRLCSYCHEIAKAFNCLDWYPVYVQIRKARDTIDLLKNPDISIV